MTLNGPVPFTEEEETDRDAHEAKVLADAPMGEWNRVMKTSDAVLPRWAEDLINLTDGAISPQAQKLADDKKTLRATKPE